METNGNVNYIKYTNQTQGLYFREFQAAQLTKYKLKFLEDFLIFYYNYASLLSSLHFKKGQIWVVYPTISKYLYFLFPNGNCLEISLYWLKFTSLEDYSFIISSSFIGAVHIFELKKKPCKYKHKFQFLNMFGFLTLIWI